MLPAACWLWRWVTGPQVLLFVPEKAAQFVLSSVQRAQEHHATLPFASQHGLIRACRLPQKCVDAFASLWSSSGVMQPAGLSSACACGGHQFLWKSE